MTDYIQIQFQDLQPEQIEILIAQLSDAAFEGFEEGETSLKAFIRSDVFDETTLNDICYKYQVSFEQSVISPENWNQIWESSFEPVEVDDFALVRAHFHPTSTKTTHEIIITPKMSFGTGHHDTTYMMIRAMKDIDFKNKSVLDFGTGTGILAILAEKLGAAQILAIDNDTWAIENSEENIVRNGVKKIELRLTDKVPDAQKFDVILANINKNVILENLNTLKQQLNANGDLLISGILRDDLNEVQETAKMMNFNCNTEIARNNWLCVHYTH